MHLSRALFLSSCLTLSVTAWAEDDGKAITLDQLPEAVRTTAQNQANGVKISEIEAETKKGKTVYEVHFGDTEVTIDVNGKVLSSKVDKEDDEDEDDKDEHGKGHHGKGHNGKGDKDDEEDEDDDKGDKGDKEKSKKGDKEKAGHDHEDDDEDEDDKKKSKKEKKSKDD